MPVALFASSGGTMTAMTASPEVVSRHRGLSVSVATGEVSGEPLAAALFCDWFAVAPGTLLVIDAAEAWAGVVWRIRSRSFSLLMSESARVDAAEAMRIGLADAITGADEAADVYLARWLADRSVAALDAAAALIRMEGGDSLERAEFARLFAIGDPYEGLTAFLEKRKPRFR